MSTPDGDHVIATTPSNSYPATEGLRASERALPAPQPAHRPGVTGIRARLDQAEASADFGAAAIAASGLPFVIIGGVVTGGIGYMGGAGAGNAFRGDEEDE